MVIQNKDKLRLGFIISRKLPMPHYDQMPSWQKRMLNKNKKVKKWSIFLAATLYYFITLFYPLLTGMYSPYYILTYTVIIVYLFFMLIIILLIYNYEKKKILSEIRKNIDPHSQ